MWVLTQKNQKKLADFIIHLFVCASLALGRTRSLWTHVPLHYWWCMHLHIGRTIFCWFCPPAIIHPFSLLHCFVDYSKGFGLCNWKLLKIGLTPFRLLSGRSLHKFIWSHNWISQAITSYFKNQPPLAGTKCFNVILIFHLVSLWQNGEILGHRAIVRAEEKGTRYFWFHS